MVSTELIKRRLVFLSFILHVLKPKRANKKLPRSNPAACKNLFQWEVVWTYNSSSTDFYHLTSKAESDPQLWTDVMLLPLLVVNQLFNCGPAVQQTNDFSSGAIRQIKKELKPQTSINNFTQIMWQNQLPLCDISLHTEPCLLYWHIACNGVIYNGAAVPRVLVGGITGRCETVNTWKVRSQPPAFFKAPLCETRRRIITPPVERFLTTYWTNVQS